MWQGHLGVVCVVVGQLLMLRVVETLVAEDGQYCACKVQVEDE
jgi:hypothetical protein